MVCGGETSPGFQEDDCISLQLSCERKQFHTADIGGDRTVCVDALFRYIMMTSMCTGYSWGKWKWVISCLQPHIPPPLRVHTIVCVSTFMYMYSAVYVHNYMQLYMVHVYGSHVHSALDTRKKA